MPDPPKKPRPPRRKASRRPRPAPRDNGRHPGGRPPIDCDPEAVRAMGACGASHAEMAAHFGVSLDTIRRRMQDQRGEFCQLYEKGFAQLRIGLRRKQIQLALEGNPTMLIWLGKQLLDQSDRPLYGEGEKEDYQTSLERALGALDDVTAPRADETDGAAGP